MKVLISKLFSTFFSQEVLKNPLFLFKKVWLQWLTISLWKKDLTEKLPTISSANGATPES